MYKLSIIVIIGLTIIPDLALSADKKIQIGLYNPDEDGKDRSVAATVLTAIDVIKEQNKILKGYQIEAYLYYAQQHTFGSAVWAALNNLGLNLTNYPMELKKAEANNQSKVRVNYQGPKEFGTTLNPIAMLGPRSTFDTRTMYPVYTTRNILHISFDAAGESLSVVKDYPYLFNSAPPVFLYVKALVQYLVHFNLDKIAFIHYSDQSKSFNSNKLTADRFEREAAENGINIVYVGEIRFDEFTDKSQYSSYFSNAFNAIKKNDIRVIVFSLTDEAMRTMICEAYRLGLYGSKYQFISILAEGMTSWVKEWKTVNCSEETQRFMSRNIIGLSRSPREKVETITEVGLTKKEIWTRIQNKMTEILSQPIPYDEWLAYVFDSVLAFALALDKILKRDPSFVENHKVGTLDPTRMNTMLNEIRQLDFIGASGRFKYKQDGDFLYRDGNIRYRKLKFKGNETKSGLEAIGLFDKDTSKITMNFSKLYYKQIPRAGPEHIENIVLLPQSVVYTMWILSGLGIIISLIFLTVNIYYRDVTYIKLSSPNINSLTCIGSILLYGAVICYGFDSRYVSEHSVAYMCNITTFMLSMGFTLTFGSLFSKTWRIYRIFTRAEAARYVVIKDIHLFTVVFLMLVVDAVLCFTWMGVSPFTLTSQLLSSLRDVKADTIENDIIHRCQCEYQSHFIFATFAYKGILMVFGLFVAYETKRIKVAAINDSKHIGLAVYNVCLFSALGSIVVFCLYDTDRFQEGYIFFGACILEITTVTLCLVFVPKVLMLLTNFEDPNFKKGRPVFNPTAQPSADDTNTNSQWSTTNSQCAMTTSTKSLNF
ncbi:gamma-aminobutyric acid type B receptor subunit 2-like [Clytia hemisphaerica]|uniref:G-protein coupled receptors family 3 profile domain-containing protein n=1 Tax=Clytia hemisphaerica TaxID=252671 RepID=A0A7M5WRZ9_9CNID